MHKKGRSMNRIYIVLLSIGITLQSQAAGDPTQFVKNNKLVIGANPGSGFFRCFISVLNNLTWCEKNRVTPIVYWDDNCCYYDPAGYNGVKKNAWEYYFEPISTASYKDSDPQWPGFFGLDGKGISLLKDLGEKSSSKKQRLQAHDLVKKYIRVKPAVLEKVEKFHNKHMAGKKTIGLHIRGTDKFTEVKPVPMEAFVAAAHELAQRYTDCQFLIATDEVALLEEAKQKLNGNVISYDSYRSPTGRAIAPHDRVQ